MKSNENVGAWRMLFRSLLIGFDYGLIRATPLTGNNLVEV